MNTPRNIIIVVADSLRYQSVYQNGDVRLPYISQNAVEFTQARSSGCWTLPATASMFTGLMPHQHGATSQTRAIHKDIPTLAEKLKTKGYKCYQVTANIATTSVFGLHRGFDEVRQIWEMVPPKFNRLQKFVALIGKPRMRKMLVSKDAVMFRLTKDTRMAITWLQLTHRDIFNEARKIIAENEAKGERSFIFINLMESHFPYHIAPTFQLISDGWLAKIRETVGMFHFINQTFLKTKNRQTSPEILQVLRNRQRATWEIIAPDIDEFVQEQHQDKDNLVVFCSDHGENFGEQGWLYHFSNVTDAGNKVPLFYLPPHQKGAIQQNAIVNAKDIHHAILKYAGFDNAFSFVNEPERSESVMQSYWYNNHGKTLDKFKFNQICFVHEGMRYMCRNGRWHRAPVSINGVEQRFQPLYTNVNPLQEAITDQAQKKYLLQTFKDFQAFSAKVGTGD